MDRIRLSDASSCQRHHHDITVSRRLGAIAKTTAEVRTKRLPTIRAYRFRDISVLLLQQCHPLFLHLLCYYLHCRVFCGHLPRGLVNPQNGKREFFFSFLRFLRKERTRCSSPTHSQLLQCLSPLQTSSSGFQNLVGFVRAA